MLPMSAVSGAVREDALRVDWYAAMTDLDACDGYVLVVVDPQTAEVDTYGPYDDMSAVTAAEDLRASLDAGGLADVTVRITRMHRPAARAA